MQASDDSAIYDALANPTRRDILAWLKRPSEHFEDQPIPLAMGISATLIVKRAGLAQSSISAHLSVLRKAGLLSSVRLGQYGFYKRDDTTINAFLTRIQNEI